jgi:outer membrane immunogenic protein
MKGMTMRKLLVGSMVAAALSTPSVAADLARPAPVYIPPPVIVPLFTWTGCYVGGNVGGIWAKNDWNDTVFGGFGSNTTSGALGGIQAGCNYQAGGWVFGIQGDYDWTNINNSSANLIFPALSDQFKVKSLASVTGRVGYAWDRFLLYAKAGGAWEQTDFSFQLAGAPVVTASATRSGWTAGVGGEYAFLNWLTGFVEYDYYGFSNNNSVGPFTCPVASCVPPPGVAQVVLQNTSIKTNANVVKAGLNFKFGPW